MFLQYPSKSHVPLATFGNIVELDVLAIDRFVQCGSSSAPESNSRREWDCRAGKSSDNSATSPPLLYFLGNRMLQAVRLLVRFDPVEAQQIGEKTLR